ncbi:uncharacterized protein LY89DRAFT_729029 [Mollisia scopiformis]|uniref:Uncharacterized protein n=1 Tax=Mollisia scopiformis TaxID=149040 RepID=A0A194XRL0_MOLSC|nr:uncharacterized protein LY89DRAFT_729029 [Mollisia scopiformis]KUJ22925.1 hypothetical protein LY89DRAFT_729029 [Mollisia scopiformis]
MALCALLFLTVYLVTFGRCQSSMEFSFPPNATQAYDDTTIANISVHFNDNMILEYQLPDSDGQLAVTQYCYASIKDMENDNGATFDKTETYNNTGTLHWNIGNGNGGNYTGINLCRLFIANYTIVNCQWGPWGIVNWNQTDDTLLYSQLFNISAAKNGTKPAVISNNKTPTSKQVTATAGTVTCPPSGIPASPIYTPVPTVEQIPPMAGNLTFPS